MRVVSMVLQNLLILFVCWTGIEFQIIDLASLKLVSKDTKKSFWELSQKRKIRASEGLATIKNGFLRLNSLAPKMGFWD